MSGNEVSPTREVTKKRVPQVRTRVLKKHTTTKTEKFVTGKRSRWRTDRKWSTGSGVTIGDVGTRDCERQTP